MNDATQKPRVSLRAMEPEDLDLLYTIENNEELWQVGVTNVPYSRYLLHDYIAQTSGDIYTDGQVRLIIEVDGKPVGLADLTDFSPKHRRAEIGIIILAQCRRRGYAHEAITLMKHYAATELHLHQLYAIVDENNSAALELFTGLQFTRNARLQDWLCSPNGYEDAVVMQTFL